LEAAGDEPAAGFFWCLDLNVRADEPFLTSLWAVTRLRPFSAFAQEFCHASGSETQQVA
jgi:hypothetical protein